MRASDAPQSRRSTRRPASAPREHEATGERAEGREGEERCEVESQHVSGLDRAADVHEQRRDRAGGEREQRAAPGPVERRQAASEREAQQQGRQGVDEDLADAQGALAERAALDRGVEEAKPHEHGPERQRGERRPDDAPARLARVRQRTGRDDRRHARQEPREQLEIEASGARDLGGDTRSQRCGAERQRRRAEPGEGQPRAREPRRGRQPAHRLEAARELVDQPFSPHAGSSPASSSRTRRIARKTRVLSAVSLMPSARAASRVE